MTYVIFFKNAGVPAIGLSPVWLSLQKVSTTQGFLPWPTFTEIGGGFYKFDLNPTETLVGLIDGGVGLPNADRYFQIVMPAGATSAFGSVPVTLNIKNAVGGAPIPDVECVLFNQDESLLVNSALSNSMGNLNLQLNPGQYVLRMRKDGWNFTVPYTFTVVGPSLSLSLVGSNVGDIEADSRKILTPKDIQY